MAEIDRELADHKRKADRVANGSGLIATLAWLLVEDLRRPVRRLRRRSRLRRLGVTGRPRRDLIRRAGEDGFLP